MSRLAIAVMLILIPTMALALGACVVVPAGGYRHGYPAGYVVVP
jgi:hypothetical protein